MEQISKSALFCCMEKFIRNTPFIAGVNERINKRILNFVKKRPAQKERAKSILDLL